MKGKCYISLLLLGALMGGCATVSQDPGILQGEEFYLKGACLRNGIHWKWDHITQVATLYYKGTKAKVLVGSDVVLVNEERVVLSVPVRMSQSTVVVPLDFQFKVIDRLRREAGRNKEGRLAKIRKIMIDPGHGGKDPGAIGRTGVYEKDIVLDIAKRLKKILKAHGLEVGMTRGGDKFVSLKQRTEKASRFGADFFLSIHANSSPARSVYGIEVFTAKKPGFVERKEKQWKINRQLLFKKLSMKTGVLDVERIVSDMLYGHKYGESKLLAARISSRAAKLTKTKNRGVKVSQFYVLRNTLIPAVLVEVGFLTNPKEEKHLKTGAYRQRVARSLAESILDYMREGL